MTNIEEILSTIEQVHKLEEDKIIYVGKPSVAFFLLPLHPGIKLGYLVNGC